MQLSKIRLTNAEHAELSELREQALKMEPKFESEREAHDFLLEQVLTPCLREAEADGITVSDRKYLRTCWLLWDRVYRHAVARPIH